jgi:hypothetical protein
MQAGGQLLVRPDYLVTVSTEVKRQDGMRQSTVHAAQTIFDPSKKESYKSQYFLVPLKRLSK